MQENEELQDKVTFFNDNPPRSIDVKDIGRQLSERKRLEEAKRKEDRVLRRSLRQSERLRQLAKAKRVAKNLRLSQRSADNLGFDDGEFELSAGDDWDVGSFIRDLRRTMGSKPADGSSDIDDLSDNEWDWLSKAISNKSVLQAFNSHDKIATLLEKAYINMHHLPMESWAVERDAISLVNTVMHDLRDSSLSHLTKEADELMAILRSPEMKGLISAHDGVAQIWASQAKKKQHKVPTFTPTASLQSAVGSVTPIRGGKSSTDTVERTVYRSPIEGCYKILAVDDQGNTVSTADGTTLVNVVLQKSNEEFFGGTVRTEGSAIVIGRIISGGLIERSGLLNEGDELLSVNGIDLMGKDVDHVSHILTNLDGQIDLLVAPILPITEAALYNDEPVAHLRALYSYEPTNDMYNPCREASIIFDKGDILRILSTRDPNWWQALRIEEAGAVGVSGSMAGLVPSPYFQRYRSLIRLRKCGGAEEDAAAGYSESEESDFDLDSTDHSPTTGTNRSSTMPSTSSLSLWISSSAAHTHGNGGDLQAFDGAPSPNGTLQTVTDPMWSAHGIGPKQLRKQRQKKSRIMRIRSIFSSSSGGGSSLHNRKFGGSNKKANEYELSMEMSSLSQIDGDQLRQLVEESARDKIRRPSLLTYELVDLYYPQPQRRRPLVLVGPTHVGRQQLIEGLIRGDPKRFALPDIHTTNSEMSSTDLQHYETITKQEFQHLQREKAFIEWGVYEQHFYGTKVSSIESIVKKGKVCVIALRPDSIRAIRRTPFLPCVIFVSPPDNLGALRELRKNLGTAVVKFSDDELKSCIDESQKMEQHYGHFFEFLIVPRSQETAIGELKQIALDLERRPQWVPAHWIDVAWQVSAQALREAGRAASGADDLIVDSERL